MVCKEKRDADDLIYADPQAGAAPVSTGRRVFVTLVVVLVALALMILALQALSVTVQGKGERYQAALTLLEEKEYAAAASALEDLEDFRDSAQLLQRLRMDSTAYLTALELVEQQRYEEAALAFLALGDYADSALWAASGVTYRRCVDQMASLGTARQTTEEDAVRTEIQTWEALADTLASLGDYEDAPAQAQICLLKAARLYLSLGDEKGVEACLDKLTPEAAEELYQEYPELEGGA